MRFVFKVIVNVFRKVVVNVSVKEGLKLTHERKDGSLLD